MSATEFYFEPWQEQSIYDNHGCPTATVYKANFTTNGLRFTAEFQNVCTTIHILWGLELVATIRGERSTSTHTAERIIKNSFGSNPDIKAFMQRHYERLVQEFKPFALGYDWE